MFSDICFLKTLDSERLIKIKTKTSFPKEKKNVKMARLGSEKNKNTRTSMFLHSFIDSSFLFILLTDR